MRQSDSKKFVAIIAMFIGVVVLIAVVRAELDTLKVGTVKRIPEKTYSGHTLLVSYSSSKLIDENDNLVQTFYCPGRIIEEDFFCYQHNRLRRFRFNKETKKWKNILSKSYLHQFHHDFDQLPNGHILILARSTEKNPKIVPGLTVIEDQIIELDKSHTPVKTWSLNENIHQINDKFGIKFPLAAEDLKVASKKWNQFEPYADWSHCNALHVVKEDRGIFKKKQVILSVPMLAVHLVIDWDTGKVVRIIKNPRPSTAHHVSVTSNGNLLLFVNHFERDANGQASSAIVIYDPKNSKIIRKIQPPADRFYSRSSGGVELLPNGNFLFPESNYGIVYEVTPDQEIVWKYINPEYKKLKQSKIAELRSNDTDLKQPLAINYYRVHRVRLPNF